MNDRGRALFHIICVRCELFEVVYESDLLNEKRRCETLTCRNCDVASWPFLNGETGVYKTVAVGAWENQLRSSSQIEKCPVADSQPSVREILPLQFPPDLGVYRLVNQCHHALIPTGSSITVSAATTL